jgi:outer membrane protein assembly factor BamB
MKKLLIVLLFSSFVGYLYAQDEMESVWQTEISHKSDFATGFSHSKGYCYAATAKEISVINNTDGKVKWTKEFKEISGKLRKIDEIIPMWDAKTLFLFERKMGKDQMACIDAEAGTLLWSSDKYQDVSEDNVVYIPEMEAFAVSLKASLVMIKARTGEDIWQTTKFSGVVGATLYSDGFLYMLNYKPTAIAALFKGFKNQIIKINIKNGDVAWDATYIGLVEKKVWTREPVVKLSLNEGKIFLALNGLQVYDANTGTKLWSCAYDINLSEEVRKPAGARNFGVYDAIADPIIVGNDVYIIDMQSKSKQYIKKYDLNSGKILWTSPELEGVKVAPNLYLVGDKLVLQVGGVVETQAYIVKEERRPDGTVITHYIHRKDFPTIKPCRLMGFSAVDGKQLWDSERFKKGITNAIIQDGKVIACSGKAIYNMNIEDGKENYELQLGDDNIGLATKILGYKDNVVIVGEKGVSEHKPSDGKTLMSGKWSKAMLEDVKGQYLLMKTEGDDIASFDLETCQYKAYNARKGADSYLSDDGLYVIIFEKKEVSKLSTK